MLAPRKKLWSTPISAVDHCMERIPLQANDCVLDIGCGDGRILLEWAVRICRGSSNDHTAPNLTSSLSFLGIDIDPDRIEDCERSVKDAKFSGRIAQELRVDFVCANAMESVEHFQKATVIFLYLIPRGLKQICPLLKEHSKRLQQTIQVATYMSKLPSADDNCIIPLGRALCRVEHQQEAAWPLYFYEIQCEDCVAGESS